MAGQGWNLGVKDIQALKNIDEYPFDEKFDDTYFNRRQIKTLVT